MDTVNKEKTYCDDDGEYGICSRVCDKLTIDRFNNNHLKSPTHLNIFRKRQQLNDKINATSHSLLGDCI